MGNMFGAGNHFCERLTEHGSAEMVNFVEICPEGVTKPGALWAGEGTKLKPDGARKCGDGESQSDLPRRGD
jgi:hypothetical protein